ncbi:MAG: hypothetical protein IH934_02890 [Nanoarchaeota archaeon]|nr:hypothetical protein [Nanoarchaeota archaeon]
MVYPNLSESEIKSLVRENWNIKWEYEPFTQFTYTPKSGKYVNIDINGFRHIGNQCKYPINFNNYNIFVFGGSTGFGVGVADNETIASKIQSKLKKYNSNVCVYNFARGFYFSSQERALLESLILKDQVPNMAIFIDGINEFFYADSEPAFTKSLKDFMGGKNKLRIALSYLPLTKVYNFLNPFSQELQSKKEEELKGTVQRYFTNKRIIEAIGKEYNIKTHFVIQPVPTYKYDLSNHIIFKNNTTILDKEVNSLLGYNILEKQYHNLRGKDKKNIIWLADMQINKNENLYVDAVHYNADFSDDIAAEIVNIIKPDLLR